MQLNRAEYNRKSRIEIAFNPAFWCGRRDLNPYGITTRPSNVRVCRFRHFRVSFFNGERYYIKQKLRCQYLFDKNSHVFFNRLTNTRDSIIISAYQFNGWEKVYSMKKRVIAVIAVLLVICVIGAGGYAGNMFGYFNRGNSAQYSVKNSEAVDSALGGKTVIFLGSSVTYGFASMGESFVDYLVAQDGLIAVKEAKNGTTLVDDKPDSYISRMKTLDRSIKADTFVCQLSTNDATQEKPLGRIADGFDRESFDTHTVAGAIEYIIAYAKETWNCPVAFYTGTRYDSETYDKMVELLGEIAEKWDIYVIDLWNNGQLNSVSGEQRALYMNDNIHPTRLGYRDWWTPVIRTELEALVNS